MLLLRVRIFNLFWAHALFTVNGDVGSLRNRRSNVSRLLLSSDRGISIFNLWFKDRI